MIVQNDVEPPRDRWNQIVVPTAKGLEAFFWNLAWFAVIVTVVFGGTCNSRSGYQQGFPDHPQRIDSVEAQRVPDVQRAFQVRQR